MQEELLEKIKQKYEEHQKETQELLKIQKRIQKLEQNKFVKEYLSLVEKTKHVSFEKISDKEDTSKMMTIFNRHQNEITETNDIYVYLGTYSYSHETDIVHGASDYRVDRQDKDADYSLYHNLEEYDSVQIPIKLCDEFEKNHNVIFPKAYFKEKYYYALQEEFIRDCILNGQEKAVSNVLRLVKTKK